MASAFEPNSWGNNSNMSEPTWSNPPKVLVEEILWSWAVVPLTRDVADRGIPFAVNQYNLDKLMKVSRSVLEFRWQPVDCQWYRQVMWNLKRSCSLSGMTNDQIKQVKLMLRKSDGISHRLYEIEGDCIIPSIYCTNFTDNLDRFQVRDVMGETSKKTKRLIGKKVRFRNQKALSMPTGGVRGPVKGPYQNGISYATFVSGAKQQNRKSPTFCEMPEAEMLELVRKISIKDC